MCKRIVYLLFFLIILVPDAAPLPNLSDIMNSLTITTQQVSESMSNYKSNLEESLKTIENSSIVEEDLTKEINKGSERYNYFQDLAQYVNDLGELLDAKVMYTNKKTVCVCVLIICRLVP